MYKPLMPQNQQEQSEAKLLAYIENELDADGRAEIEKHLAAHPQHRKLLGEMRGMRDWVRWLPRETAPTELVESFQGKLERSVLLGPPDQASPERMRFKRWPQVRAAAAVAAVAAGLGVIVYVALPSRHNPFATVTGASRPASMNLPTTGPSELASQSNGAVKAAQTRESIADATGAVDDPSHDFKRSAAPELAPATRPDESPIALAKGAAPDALRSAGTTDDGSAIAPALAVALPATEPAVAEAANSVAEPTRELDRVARGTYLMVNADPAMIDLLNHPATGGYRGNQGNGGSEESPPARNQYVMVVLSSDTDRARKQIGDYLANNGIAAQVVNDSDAQALSDPTSVAAKPAGDESAAPVLRPGSSAAASPAQVSTAAAPGALALTPAAPAGSPAAPERRSVAPPSAPVPQAGRPAQQRFAASLVAPAPVPASVERVNNKVAPPAPAGAAAPVASVGLTVPANAGAREKIASPDDDNELLTLTRANGDIFIARRMTARQARDLQANLRKPQAAQWAGVYSELLRSPTPPGQLSDKQAVGAPRSASPRAQARADEASPQKAQVRDAAGEVSAARKMSSPAADKADGLARKGAPALAHSTSSGQLPSAGAGPASLESSRGAAMSPSAERARALGSFPAPAAAPLSPPAVGGAGADQAHADRPNNREQARDAVMAAPFNAPATQPTEPQHLLQAAATTAPAEVAADDQPVDIVIVLQQSPAAPAPAGSPAAATTPGLPTTPATRP